MMVQKSRGVQQDKYCPLCGSYLGGKKKITGQKKEKNTGKLNQQNTVWTQAAL